MIAISSATETRQPERIGAIVAELLARDLWPRTRLVSIGAPNPLPVTKQLFAGLQSGNRPVPPGVPGCKVLLTNLAARTLPLIRYELSDSVTIADGPNPAGRPYGLIASIDGRNDDIVHLPAKAGGTIAVPPYRLHAPFATLSWVSRSICAMGAAALLSAGCEWGRLDKIGGPQFSKSTRKVPLQFEKGVHRGASLELEVLDANLDELRTAVSLEYCHLNLAYRLRNLAAEPYDLWSKGNGFKAAETREQPPRTFIFNANLGVRENVRMVAPGEKREFQNQSVLGAFPCEHPIALVIGGIEVPMRR
jgi:hypothetical protein